MTNGGSLKTHTTHGVLHVVINRPGTRNALDANTQRDIRDLLDRAHDAGDVGGVIFTGVERTFISGANLAELRDRDLSMGLRGDLQRLLRDLQAFEKPTLAAINGHALGGGLEFALACDLRVASRDARLGLPELGLGIMPGAGGTQRLARHVGVGRAVEMILTGRLLEADEARSAGLLAEVVDPDLLLVRSEEIMTGVLAKAPLAARLAKMITRASLDVDENTGLLIERLGQALLYTTEDKNEGVDAFLSRRPPQFTGR